MPKYRRLTLRSPSTVRPAPAAVPAADVPQPTEDPSITPSLHVALNRRLLVILAGILAMLIALTVTLIVTLSSDSLQDRMADEGIPVIGDINGVRSGACLTLTGESVGSDVLRYVGYTDYQVSRIIDLAKQSGEC